MMLRDQFGRQWSAGTTLAWSRGLQKTRSSDTRISSILDRLSITYFRYSSITEKMKLEE